VGRAIYFQLLDEQGMAVHSMRSVTYVHPGEQMTCVGCHEARQDTPPAIAKPAAFRRAPSKIQPEVSSGAIPFNYEVLVRRPVFDKKCVGCHQQHNKKYPPKFDPNDKSQNPRDLNADKRAPDMSYGSLARYSILFGMPGENNSIRMAGVGGSRTTPGKVGAHVSGLLHSLRTQPYHKGILDKLSKDELRRITLWLDMNSNRICWIDDNDENYQAQYRGESKMPPVDFDPNNPLSVETDRPLGW
jgi:cytochrome c553